MHILQVWHMICIYFAYFCIFQGHQRPCLWLHILAYLLHIYAYFFCICLHILCIFVHMFAYFKDIFAYNGIFCAYHCIFLFTCSCILMHIFVSIFVHITAYVRTYIAYFHFAYPLSRWPGCYAHTTTWRALPRFPRDLWLHVKGCHHRAYLGLRGGRGEESWQHHDVRVRVWDGDAGCLREG